MIFYLLHLPKVEPERLALLKDACAELKISFKPLDPYSFDFSRPSPLKKGDILYRTGRGKLLRTFENYLLKPGIATFYCDPVPLRRDPFTLQKNEISAPLTIYCPAADRSQLDHYVDELGGFPVVLKVLGGTHGLGVMKVDSYSTLYGLVDYILAQGRILVLRQFIEAKTSARFIVLDGKVIASIEYESLKRDFRSNEAKSPKVYPKKYSKDVEALAIKAVKVMGLEFGGVDVLLKDEKAYVTEVNFPCNFVRAQKVLNFDIALEMVKYLQRKAEKMLLKR